MSKEYTVIKPFVDETGSLWTVGTELNASEIAVRMAEPLKKYGYIEQTKLHKLSLWAESLGWRWDAGMKLFKIELHEDGGGQLTTTLNKEAMKLFYDATQRKEVI